MNGYGFRPITQTYRPRTQYLSNSNRPGTQLYWPILSRFPDQINRIIQLIPPYNSKPVEIIPPFYSIFLNKVLTVSAPLPFDQHARTKLNYLNSIRSVFLPKLQQKKVSGLRLRPFWSNRPGTQRFRPETQQNRLFFQHLRPETQRFRPKTQQNRPLTQNQKAESIINKGFFGVLYNTIQY